MLDSSFFGDTANERLGRETPDEAGWELYGCLLSESINGICIEQEGWEDARCGVHQLSVADVRGLNAQLDAITRLC